MKHIIPRRFFNILEIKKFSLMLQSDIRKLFTRSRNELVKIAIFDEFK